MIPSSATVQKAYRDDSWESGFPEDLHVSPRSRLHARGMVAYIIALLSDNRHESPGYLMDTKYISGQSNWLTNTIFRLWRSMAPQSVQLLDNHISAFSLALFLKSVRLCCIRMMIDKSPASMAARMSNLLMYTALVTLGDLPLPLDPNLEKTLSTNLLEIVTLVQSPRQINSGLIDVIAKGLSNVVAKQGRFEGLGHDLQVWSPSPYEITY